MTECYSFEDGNSRYLCNPDLEYCKRGRCALYDFRKHARAIREDLKSGRLRIEALEDWRPWR